MTDARILDSIPHRPPMLLIDEIEELTEESIVCKKSFSDEEYFFQGHFPGNPIVPGVILCECAAQAGAVLLFQKNRETVGGTPLLTRMSDVKLKQMVRPGETISIHVNLNEIVSTAFLMSARIRKNGKLAASVSFTCTIQSND